MGHIKADCRKKRIANKKAAKGKQNPQRKPNAAAPHDDEREPLSASSGWKHVLIAALPGSCKHVLVDTGAGSRLFEKNFDPNATTTTKGSSSGMVSVTGETLDTGFKKKVWLQLTMVRSFRLNTVNQTRSVSAFCQLVKLRNV